MRSTPRRHLLIGLCLTLLGVVLAAAAPASRPQVSDGVRYDSTAVDVRRPPGEDLARFRDDPAFFYDRTPPRPSPWLRFWQWVGEQLAWLNTPATGTFLSWLFRLIAVGLIVFAILRLLRMDIKGVFYGRSDRPRVAFDEIGGDIEGVDFDRLIEEAVAARAYRRAVRLYYLKTLKELTVRDLIEWRQDKTNHEYARELRDPAQRAAFSRLTYLFEHIWYGDFAVDAARFESARNTFDAFIARLGAPSPQAAAPSPQAAAPSPTSS